MDVNSRHFVRNASKSCADGTFTFTFERNPVRPDVRADDSMAPLFENDTNRNDRCVR